MQVWFMPWAGLAAETRLGPVTFWPFHIMAESEIQDDAIREHLTRYFSSYVDHQRRPVETITVCSHGSPDFRDLTPHEASDVRAAVDGLIFSILPPGLKTAVCANNNSIGPPSAERYQLYAQNFQPGSDDLSVRAGSLLSGGWRIGEITFPQPWCMGGSFGLPDKELLLGLGAVLEGQTPVDFRNRLFRSLEWFRYAHAQSDDVSSLSKIVMMATAFEILLAVPNVPDKSGWMAGEVETRCSLPESIREKRRDGKGNDQERSRIGWWAWDFYKLRNVIVHGDEIQPDRLRYPTPDVDWLSQLHVADLVFWEWVMRDLFAQHCVGADVRACSAHLNQLFPNEPPGRAESALTGWFLGYDRVHEALGWLPESRKSP